MTKFYAAKNSNDEDRSNSSSGGVFLALSKKILDENGVVYGAIYNEKLEVVHSRTETIDELMKMTGSKYCNSELGDTFKKIQEDLDNGKKVLFTGTPCQVSTINKIVKNKDNLITIDVVCHGTPNNRYLKDYISMLEKKYNSKIKNLNMRYKDKEKYNKNLNGKHKSHGPVEPKYMKIDFCNGKTIIERSDLNIYYSLFDLFIKEGCFKCPFANLNREGDITIGDFHEYSTQLKDFNDGNGVSLVIINTKKGEKFFSKIQKEFQLLEKDEKECIQPSLVKPTIKHPLYESFTKDYNDNGFEFVVKKYAIKGIKYRIKWLLYKTKILDLIYTIKNTIAK